MNNLKFINKLIKDYKESKERFARNLIKYPNDEVFMKCVETREQELQTLQQIKEILEAWEIVKQNFVLQWEDKDNASGYYLKYFGNKEYEILKKALEVKDE